jgi:alkanesulfonate monooxygenase SsuD/methylene tetrahydromethanopterin reductase-like flavin-dependent oxidoreductase (luciferase family)
MRFDCFFSISQTPVQGQTPSEKTMFDNFFSQVRAADELGFETAWIAESHLSTQVQKQHKNPVVPFWEGEIGLNVDILQMAHQIFAQTRRIHVGSAVMNILVNGGPLAAAERIALFLALHGRNPDERRRLKIGFAQGRFEFMNRAAGIVPRNPVEELAWPALRSKIFAEACEIFLRLLQGETLASDAVRAPTLQAGDFRDETTWNKLQNLTNHPKAEKITCDRRWQFEILKIVPSEFRRDLLELYLGSHETALQDQVNQWCPVRVFNLSITRPEVIEETHQRLSQKFHPTGGPWQRSYMPRTLMVFINEEAHLTRDERRKAARHEADMALSAYWKALEGTIDPQKIAAATDNAVVGDAEEVAEQIAKRFDADDCLMLWFDFFNHDSDRVIRNMAAFTNQVIPRLRGTTHGTR